MILWNRSPGLGIAEDWFSTAQFFDIKASHRGFEELAIAIGANYNLAGAGEPERVGTLRVSSNLLSLLGARAAAGRLFGPADDVPGTTGTAVLGHATWMRRYGGDPGVIGRSLVLNGQPYEVIGVLEAGFDIPREVLPTLGGAEHADVILPLPLDAEAARVRNREDYNLLGKLKAGVSEAQAQAEMDTLTARLRQDHPGFYPANGGLTFDVVPLHEQVVGDVRQPLMILTAAVGLVLLIACRQRGQPPPLARHRPPEGRGGADGARGLAPAARAGAPRREPAPGPGRGDARTAVLCGKRPGPPRSSAPPACRASTRSASAPRCCSSPS